MGFEDSDTTAGSDLEMAERPRLVSKISELVSGLQNNKSFVL
jgi:hypothetical protein